jgi:4'-phosphopantetheinyl transferase
VRREHVRACELRVIAHSPADRRVSGGWEVLAQLRLTLTRKRLVADEREAAAWFRFPRDRRRFVAARGLLPVLLARYLGAAPAAVAIRRDPGGKPRLDEPADLRFTVSHSDDLALYAVAWRREVGIDVERIQPALDWARLADRFFSAPERAALAAAGAHAATTFTRIWVGKEAYLKATGMGLAGGLDIFAVAPDYPAAVDAAGQDWRAVVGDLEREAVSVR